MIDVILAKIKEANLSPSDVHKLSFGLISINQASQWLRDTKKASNPTLIMLWQMCQLKLEGKSTMNMNLSDKYIASQAVPVEKISYPCVYFLLQDNKIVYVGQSKNSITRITTHKQRIPFNKVFIMFVHESMLTEVERLYIKKFCPQYNISQKPKEPESIAFDALPAEYPVNVAPGSFIKRGNRIFFKYGKIVFSVFDNGQTELTFEYNNIPKKATLMSTGIFGSVEFK